MKSKYIVENQTGMIIEVKQVWYSAPYPGPDAMAAGTR